MNDGNECKSGPASGGAAGVEPLVISDGEHPIRTRDIDKEALKVLYRLRDAGFAGYLVGGGVRDLYLGKRPKDFDISTNARPGQIRKIFRNSRTIGRRFRLVQVYFRGGKIVEVSTLRSQDEYDITAPDKVLASNNTFGTLAEDAFRRDLTINSLFYEIENNTLIDYTGGVRDLDQGVVRIVGEPERRVIRDPVRIMRAIRHASRNGFEIDGKSWDAITANCGKLNLCPPSRIRDELLKDLRGGSSKPWAGLAIKSGLFQTLFPFYRELLDSGMDGGPAKLLLSLLGVVDKIGNRVQRDGMRLEMPDHFLFAVLILPWALERFGLLGQRKNGQSFYHLSRELRTELDGLFAESFNLKRMDKESLVMLLVNLSTFAQHHRNQNWPKWLRRKSYFDDCYRFYCLFEEARGGRPVDEKLFAAVGGDKDRDAFIPDESGENDGRPAGKRWGVKPAFTKRKQGVFGFRKR